MVVKGFSLLSIVFLTLVCSAAGQGFDVSVNTGRVQRGSMEMLIYDRNDAPRRLTAKVAGGVATFSGKVKQPVYAELRVVQAITSTSSWASTPLPFFIENSQISIVFDTANPAASRVVGSRSNSQMRYQAELCRDNIGSLRRHIFENPSEPYNAYLLYNFISSIDPAEMDTLIALLDGKEAWHYRLVQKKTQQLRQLQEGQQLPSFTFTDSTGTVMSIDSLLADTSASPVHARKAIIVGTTWCQQCNEAAKTIKQNYPNLQVVYINLDQQKKGWDSPVAEALAIDHIPYIILLDSQGKILSHDIRPWELKGYGEW